MLSSEKIGSGKQPLTLTEWAEQRIRSSIMEGELRPSETLVISNLAEQMGISATPLREALRKLAAEGLVDL
ncbi:MAG: GntR family transcriptional regulator, partial [Acidimicrobiia bacterium]|nr:GntR family transcriptional regulator [Acidimicrobiia bacterium]